MTTNLNNIFYIDPDITRNYELNNIIIERNYNMNFDDYIINNVINNVINNYLYQDIIIPHKITFTSDIKYVGETCSICAECVENVDTMAVSSCSHVFHQACISKWNERSKKCPNCRQDMS